MENFTYHSLVWLTYRLGAAFAFGLPLILFIWSSMKKEIALIRLLSIYWKISSLMAISIMLLTGDKSIGYITSFIAPLVMVISVWFWVDINEEITDLPSTKPLILTIKIWRWSLSAFCLLAISVTYFSLPCFNTTQRIECNFWLEAPKTLHQITEKIFSFLFGANWSEPLVGFIGYIALLLYIVGILQWTLVQMPKQGRVAGGF